jgi:uncharacterized protein YfaS (alpha-2-macroglobulin family)
MWSGMTLLRTKGLALLLAIHLVLISSATNPIYLPQPALAQEAADESDKVRFTLSPVVEPCNDTSKSSTASSKQNTNALQKQTALTNGQVKALFEKLAPLPLFEQASSKLVLPEDSLVKPLTEIQPTATFQPPTEGVKRPESSPAISSEPLTVTRISHSGVVDDLKKLTITFSQPLVELSTLGQLSAKAPEQFISITPQPKGSWQWAGSQTLIFTPEGGRFPKATNYVVTIPASAKSITGNQIDKTYIYHLDLPAVKIAEFYPPETARENQSPLLVAHFNQNIDQEKVLAKTYITVGKRSYAIKAVSKKEYKGCLEAMRKARQNGDELPENGQSWLTTASILQLPNETDNDFVVFEPTEKLPKNSTIKVIFGKNMPSEEGPLTSKAAEERTFKTYGPLKLITKSINIAPTSPANIFTRYESSTQRHTFKFNNTIESTKFDPSLVRITPPVEEFQTHKHFKMRPEDSITIEGRFKPFTRYKVTFDEKLTDIFGQSLGKQEHALLDSHGLTPMVRQLNGFKTLSPDEPLVYSVWAQGAQTLRASIHKVQPEDWDKYNKNYRNSEITVGTLADTVDFKLGPLGKRIDIDLKPYISSRYGHLILSFKLIEPDHTETESNCWIQVTDMALDLYTRGNLLVLASKLSDGKPLEGVEVSLVDSGKKSNTDASGLATMSTPKTAFPSVTLVGKKDSDSCVVTVINFERFGVDSGNHNFNLYVTSDRHLYKPGERICIKGIFRGCKYPDNGAIELSYPPFERVTYTLYQNNNGSITEGETFVDEKGSFAFDFVLPQKIQLGEARLYFSPKTSNKKPIRPLDNPLVIKIEEFRRPEFETSITSSKGNSILLGEETTLTSNNTYYSGGALSDSRNQWVVKAQIRPFTPPGWLGYQFNCVDYHARSYTDRTSTDSNKALSVQTDSRGQGSIKLASEFNKEKSAVTFECESTVSDIHRQDWTSKLTLIAHPAEIYVGIKKSGITHADGDSLWTVVATDIDGKIASGTKVDLTFNESNSAGGEPAVQRSIIIGDHPVAVSFKKHPDSKIALLSASVKDPRGRINQCCETDIMPQFVACNGLTLFVKRGEVGLSSDKPSYALGDKAKLTIRSNDFPVSGMLVLSKSKILTTLPLTLEGPEKTIELPILEAYYPNIVITAFLANNRTSYSVGEHTIQVPPVKKTLTLKVEPSVTSSSPSREITLNVELRDQTEPVKNGQVAIAAVDESILTLADYKWPNPIQQFYPKSEGHLYSVHSRTQEPGFMIMVANSRMVSSDFYESDGKGDSRTELKPMLGFRKDLAALAFFKPVVTTDSDGKAQVKFKLPDSVTRYRIMAIAAAGTDKFGSSESSLTTKLPLMLKPSPPRFLSFGDSCELPVIIQNQTDKPLKTEIALRSNNAEITEPGKLVEVPANDRIEVRFAVKAISNGQATFQCVAKTDSLSDSTEFRLPILVPASKESVATYGVIDKGAIVQKLAAPSNVIESIGGLTISTSSSAMQSLSDSFDYLRNYQYDCSEQVSSRLIAMVSMQDALLAFGAVKQNEVGTYKRRIEDDIALLEKRQNSSGDFGLWAPAESTKWPYVSIQVTQALLLAKAKLYPVNERVLKQAVTHLKEIEKDIPADYDRSAKLAVLARSLNIRHLAHDSDSLAARELLLKAAGHKFDEIPLDKIKSALPVEMAAWLLPVLKTNQSYSREIEFLRKFISSQIAESASTASTNDNGYGDCNYTMFYSPRRVDASVTSALIEDQPDNPLIPKLVKGLLAGRRNGIWQGTQENSYVLQTLDKYFSTYEKQTPDFAAQAWLNDTLVANDKFVGRSLDTKSTTLPMEYLLSKGKATNNILINKEGMGRVYYKVALDYASKDLNLKQINQGFAVTRTYEPVDANSDVTKDEKGIWHFKAGSTIRVKVQFEAPSARYHVAMCDPLPAGTEAINKTLAGTRSLSQDILLSEITGSETMAASDGEIRPVSNIDSRETYIQHWYEHENLRDHQAEAFVSLLNAGKYRYSYLIRATTPGHFTVPPTKVEEMYMPETFGRSHSEKVVIE